MDIKQSILTFLVNRLNDNDLDIQFVLGKLGQTQNSTFTIQRFGTQPGEKWYEVITESFVPVVANTFDSVYLFDDQFKQETIVGRFSFLVRQEEQETIVPVIDEFISGLIGLTTVLDNTYNIFCEPQGLEFVQTIVLNDIKFLEFELPFTIRTAEYAAFGKDFNIYIKEQDAEDYAYLNIISYDVARVQQTSPVQLVNTNRTKSVIQSSSWSAAVRFFVRKQEYYESDAINSIIELTEGINTPNNKVYTFKIYNPFTNTSYEKDVVISSASMMVRNAELATITISMEEANTEVI
jgi:hypothetical protein